MSRLPEGRHSTDLTQPTSHLHSWEIKVVIPRNLNSFVKIATSKIKDEALPGPARSTLFLHRAISLDDSENP